MKTTIMRGTTSKLVQVFVMDSSQTDGRGLTGLVFNTANLTAYHYREGAGATVQINLVNMAVGTWASGGFIEIDAANMPGWYQVGIPDAALVDGADSVGVMLKGAADMAPINLEIQLGVFFEDDGTAVFDPTTDSLQAIADSVAAAAPIAYHPNASSVITVGNQDSGTWADTATDNDVWWVIGDENGSPTIDVICQFNMAANRIASSVEINGYYNRSGGGGYKVEIYAYNYTSATWDKISSNSVNNEMRDRNNDKNYAFALGVEHTDPDGVPGTVLIRFQSTRDTTQGGDTLNLDHVHITGQAEGAISPAALANAVWEYAILGSATEGSAAYFLRTIRALITEISVGDTATSFTLADGVAVNDAYNNMIIMVEDETDDHYEVRRVTDYTSGLVVTVDRAFGFLPAAGDHIYLMATGYAESPEEHASAVWDEVLTGATHNIPTSAGRRLRGIQEFQGYELGSIWIDTVNGNAGTVDYENGTVENPVDSLTDALVLAASLNVSRFQVTPDSTLTLDDSVAGMNFSGMGWTLVLGNQNCSGAIFTGARVSGTCTSDGTHVHFHDCFMGACTLPAGHMLRCALEDKITISEAGDYFWDNCYSGVAGINTPFVDFGAALGNSQLNMRHYSGGIEVENIGAAGTDNMSLEGFGQIILNANCAGGIIAIRGNFTVTDNASGVVTLSDDARYDVGQINDEVVDVIRTDTVAEIAAVPASNAPLHTMLQWLYTIVRNKRITTADKDTLRNDGDGADIAESALTHTATTFTRGKYS
jgi:hypothetical protein